MKQWQEFSARQSDIRVNENFVCAADDIGLILVNGADARDFLQNQLSNDIDFIINKPSWEVRHVRNCRTHRQSK